MEVVTPNLLSHSHSKTPGKNKVEGLDDGSLYCLQRYTPSCVRTAPVPWSTVQRFPKETAPNIQEIFPKRCAVVLSSSPDMQARMHTHSLSLNVNSPDSHLLCSHTSDCR